jgi:hypothetical protein
MTYAPSLQLYPPGHRHGNPHKWMWTIDELEEAGTANTGDEATEQMWAAWEKGEEKHHAAKEAEDGEREDDRQNGDPERQFLYVRP